jgi:hydrogenase maturation protease
MAWSELLDDGFAPDPCRLLVIGCGNILRGDDAVGPTMIRHLFERGVPDGVRLVDGGTAGMDVAFGMRGAERVVIVDAAQTGADPGTLYRVPAEQLGLLPPIDGLHTHNFRWDHALSFSAWLLGADAPSDVTVFLVEAGQLEFGAELTPAVAAGMQLVIELIESEFYPRTVEVTESGYLHLPAGLAAEHFPGDTCVARMDGDTLVLMPLVSAAHGGLVLKQRNAAGDRSLLVSEVFSFEPVCGTFEVQWDEDRGALRVEMAGGLHGTAQRDRGPDRGGARVGSVGGLPVGHHPGGDRPAPAPDVLHRGEGKIRGGRDPADGDPPAGAQEQSR